MTKEKNIPTVEDLWEAYWGTVNPEYGNIAFQVQAERETREEFDLAISRIRAMIEEKHEVPSDVQTALSEAERVYPTMVKDSDPERAMRALIKALHAEEENS